MYPRARPRLQERAKRFGPEPESRAPHRPTRLQLRESLLHVAEQEFEMIGGHPPTEEGDDEAGHHGRSNPGSSPRVIARIPASDCRSSARPAGSIR